MEANSKVAIAAYKTPPAGYQVKGTFQGFQTSGPLVDQFTKMFEALGVKVKSVATIKVDEVYSLSPANPGEKLV